jgi:hypothetical protein
LVDLNERSLAALAITKVIHIARLAPHAWYFLEVKGALAPSSIEQGEMRLA